MTTDEVLDDLSQRLNNAATQLLALANQHQEGGDQRQVDRLNGKRAGVELALDYLRAYR